MSDNVLTLNEESTSFPGNSKLQTLYSGLITWHMVKKAVDDAVQTEIREDTYDYLHETDTNITSIVTTVYTYAEVEALITAINSLGITTLDEISTLEIDDKLSTLDIDALFDSTITWDIVSVKFHDIIVDDTDLLVGKCPPKGIVLLLGKFLHLFGFTEGGLRATGIGTALNDVAPGFIERVPAFVFLHPVLLLPCLFLQTHPVLRVIDQREAFIASCLFIIQVAFFLGILDPLVADAEDRVHFT
jgi:hypothetical protein